MICPHCKATLEKLSKHCPECGGDLSSLNEATSEDEKKKEVVSLPSDSNPKKSSSGKTILVIFAVIACLSAVIFFNSDTHKFNNYEFTNEQVSFLKSLEISHYNVDDRTFMVDAGEGYALENTIVIKVDKNYQITEVYPLTNFDKVIYKKDDNLISRFSPWEEHTRAISDFINGHTTQYNQSNQLTIVDPAPNKYPFGHVGIYNYLYYEGKGESYKDSIEGKAGIYSVLHYSGRDWIFFDKIVFSTSSKSWTYYVKGDIEHQVVTGGVHEYITVKFCDLFPGMKLLTEGENPQIEFVGKHSTVVPLYSGDIDSIKEYINLYDRL